MRSGEVDLRWRVEVAGETEPRYYLMLDAASAGVERAAQAGCVVRVFDDTTGLLLMAYTPGEPAQVLRENIPTTGAALGAWRTT